MPVLDRSFYDREDVVTIAKELLGCVLITSAREGDTSGIIVETEAYAGSSDRASHAWNGRRTPRNEAMYGPPGTAYIYLCYGIHDMMNVVTNRTEIPHAILIRAVEPVEGIPLMRQRRNFSGPEHRIASGPGLVTKALGITRTHNGKPLNGTEIRITQGIPVPAGQIIASARVGVAYAGEDALLPLRFRILNNRFVSPAK
jgi:DNA-3-methyladenine glycosylase